MTFGSTSAPCCQENIKEEASPLLCQHKPSTRNTSKRKNITTATLYSYGVSPSGTDYTTSIGYASSEVEDDEAESTSSTDDSLLNVDVETQVPVKDNRGDQGKDYGSSSTNNINEINLDSKTPMHKTSTIWEKVDKTAFQFALRMAILLCFSSLFVLIRTDDWHFPDGMWVLVTVLFVSWFPQLDAASVIEKIMQRLIGTFVGSFLGLSCGFTSLLITDHHTTQATFLGCCVFLFNFLIIFIAGQCKVGRVKVIKKFAYATILCVLTFCICIMPFSMDEDPKWERAMFRVLTVIIGCIVGALGSILIVPKSTDDVLYTKAFRQVQMAGEAAEAVMNVSSDFFAGRIEVNRLADELLNAPLESELKWRLSSASSFGSASALNTGATDVALKKYEDAIADWRLSKMLFPLVKFDPFKIRLSPDKPLDDAFNTEIARTLARCLRIQTTIVVIDGMVRSDADYAFSQDQLTSFSEIGTLIHQMLTLPMDRNGSNTAASRLFLKFDETKSAIQKVSNDVATAEAVSEASRSDSLEAFRKNLLSERKDVVDPRKISSDGDDLGRGIPVNCTGKDDNTLFFLQLVEHLILRSLRLFEAWSHVETIRKH